MRPGGGSGTAGFQRRDPHSLQQVRGYEVTGLVLRLDLLKRFKHNLSPPTPTPPPHHPPPLKSPLRGSELASSFNSTQEANNNNKTVKVQLSSKHNMHFKHSTFFQENVNIRQSVSQQQSERKVSIREYCLALAYKGEECCTWQSILQPEWKMGFITLLPI